MMQAAATHAEAQLTIRSSVPPFPSTPTGSDMHLPKSAKDSSKSTYTPPRRRRPLKSGRSASSLTVPKSSHTGRRATVRMSVAKQVKTRHAAALVAVAAAEQPLEETTSVPSRRFHSSWLGTIRSAHTKNAQMDARSHQKQPHEKALSPDDGDIAAELVRGPREPLPRGRLRPEDPRIEAKTGLDLKSLRT